MPLFDFKCPECGAELRDRFMPYAESNKPRPCLCGGTYEKQVSAACFSVRGFNALNHYGAKETTKTVKGESLIGPAGAGMKVTTHEHT